MGEPVQVSLKIDDQVKKTSSDRNFQTDVVAVGTGNHQVSEDFASDPVAALYDSSYVCKKGSTVVKSGDGVLVADGVHITDGEAIVCTFTNTRKDLALLVDKTAEPNALDEPGGPVTFTVEVVNQTDAPATLTSLKDDVYGNLDATTADDQHTWTTSDCTIGSGIPLQAYNGRVLGEDTYRCHFTADLTGGGGSTHRNTVTATITDAAGGTKTADAEAVVNIIDIQPSIQVTKTADPLRIQDSGLVTYTAVVTNTSTVDPLNVDRLTDSIYGDLLNGPTKAHCTLGGAGVALPHTLPVGESLICTFQATVSATQTDTLTASGTDSEGNRVQDADAAIVVVAVTPPPPPTPAPPVPPVPPVPEVPPAPSPEPVPPNVNLSVTKIAPPDAVSLNTQGLASFDYTIAVSAAGPAPRTTLTDTAPQGTRFIRIVRQPSQGSCALAHRGRQLTCDLGDLVAGQSVDMAVRIAVSAALAKTTTIENTAVATCKPTPGVTCTSKDTAKTRLLAPFLPPAGCNTIRANKLVLSATGAPQSVVVSVDPERQTGRRCHRRSHRP